MICKKRHYRGTNCCDYYSVSCGRTAKLIQQTSSDDADRAHGIRVPLRARIGLTPRRHTCYFGQYHGRVKALFGQASPRGIVQLRSHCGSPD
jgi:hypothetical protein